MKPNLADITAAAGAIRGVADNTPMIPSPAFSAIAGHEVLLKLENMQPIGAFKLRGAMNAVSKLSDDCAGVICCSTGNHGRGVAFAAARRGLRAVVCMSDMVPKAKVEGIRALGAEIHICGQSQDDAQAEVLRLCAAEGLHEIPPFDDRHVIAGQATIGAEMMAARPDLSQIIVPLSGGGLAAGVALAAKSAKPTLRIIGVSMDRGAAMHSALLAGQPVDIKEVPSLADSLGGGIGTDNRLSFQMCRDLLDDVILVTEEEIYRAMQAIYFQERLVAEGGSAVGIAALLSGKLGEISGPIATIITGRNLDMSVFTRIVNGQSVTLGDYTVKGHTYEK